MFSDWYLSRRHSFSATVNIMPINGLTKVHRPSQKTIEIKVASDEPDSQQNEPSKAVTSPSAEYNSTSKEKKEVEKWSTGEKILCFHGPLIYEAKIQMVCDI